MHLLKMSKGSAIGPIWVHGHRSSLEGKQKRPAQRPAFRCLIRLLLFLLGSQKGETVGLRPPLEPWSLYGSSL